MRVYDRFGYAHEIPGPQPIGRAHAYDQPQVVYDGFGDPVGFAFLAPFLPLIAKAAGAILPTVASFLTSSTRAAVAPPSPPTPQPVPVPQTIPVPLPPSTAAPSPQILVIREPAPAMVPSMLPPGQITPTTILRTRRLHRRRPVRLRVERVTEQVSVPPSSLVHPRPSSMTAEPLPAEPASTVSQSRSEMSGWYPAQFGRYL
jgi:hypothetical protein